MKTIDQIYQIARDIDGLSHCYVTYYRPGQGLRIMFPGMNYGEYMELFIAMHCTGHQHTFDGQELTVGTI